jgi:hypothetical protein
MLDGVSDRTMEIVLWFAAHNIQEGEGPGFGPRLRWNLRGKEPLRGRADPAQEFCGIIFARRSRSRQGKEAEEFLSAEGGAFSKRFTLGSAERDPSATPLVDEVRAEC